MHMDEQFFSDRLIELRLRKNVSAREMSLAIGQNPSYINRIENRLAYPSMQVFFYICEYLGVTPSEFFDGDNSAPAQRRELHSAVERLNEAQTELVLTLIRELLNDKGRKP
jgi:transcriptional regulator with XRE-family HTH domain